jgi:hypothetical protein
MPLQKQNAPVQMGYGVDTKTDPKQVQGKLLTLENGRLETYQRIQKRPGYALTTTLSSNAQGLGVLNDDLILFGNADVKTYSPAAGLVSRYTPFAAAQLTSSKTVSTNENQVATDMGIHAATGVRVVTWLAYSGSGAASNGVYYCVQDSNTNTTLVSATRLTTNESVPPRVIVVGAYIVIVYTNGTDILYAAVNSASPTSAPSSATVVSSLTIFDACSLSNTGYICYKKDATHLSFKSLSSSLVLSSATDVAVTISVTNISITADSTASRLWVAYSASTSIKYLIVSTAFAVVLAETAVDTTATNVLEIATYASNNSGIIVYSMIGASGAADLNTVLTKKATANSAGTVSAASFKRGVGVISNIFSVTVGSATMLCFIVGYATIGYNSTDADGDPVPNASIGNLFLVNDSGTILAYLGASGNAQGLSAAHLDKAGISRPSGVTLTSSTRFQIPYLLADDTGPRLGTSLTTGRFGTSIALFDFASTRSYQTVTASNDLHAVTGIEGLYDSATFTEHSYFYKPEVTALSDHASGGGTFAVGRYAYYAVYRWMDNQGNVHYSEPSDIDSINVASTADYIDVTVTTLRLTAKSGVIINLYRNNLSDPTTYYLVGTGVNTTAADTITIRDSDGAINTALPVIYTNGGVAPNLAVPSPRCQWTYKNRVMVVPEETPSIVWFSKLLQQSIPSNPVEFSDEFQYQLNTYDGGIVAGTQMDEKCILFKANTIWYFVGDGPADTGLNNDFTPAQEIPTDAGCSEGRSVITTPTGTLFKTLKGIYLLDRSLQVSYIGSDVAAYNSSTIKSAEMIRNTTLVRFLLDSGVALNYDYLIGQWSVDTGFTNAVDAAIFGGSYVYVNSAGQLLTETAGLFTDNSSGYSLKIKTNWMSFAGLQGYQRAYKYLFLGDYISAHTMNIAIAYDFESTPSQTLSFNAATTFGTPGVMQGRVFMTTQKCEAVQVTMYDSSATGESFNLSGIAFEVGVEPNLNRLPAAKSFG